ncbi:MAG: ABC transporter ATP-binding protein [Polyangiaceae bacterium]|nr:ABC transporter ATP-binding protein [Polyangiaceae bacterium]
MSLLVLENVGKSYPAKRGATEVLRGVHLTIEEEELVSVVGYSGSGKTTLVSLIAGLIAPSEGSLAFDGRPVCGPAPDRGVVFQSYSLLPWLSVYENVELAVAEVFPALSDTQRREHVDRYVAMVGLSAAQKKRPAQLSGGMRQRVALARALAMEPRMLLLDEPLGALDALTRATLQDELERICRISGKTILLITNDVDEAILLSDRIVPLAHGPAARLGPSFEVSLPRPRVRRDAFESAKWRKLRAEIVEFLRNSASEQRATSSVPTAAASAVPVEVMG